ncbi:MAG: helix-turn-helix transcriptional regulator [Oscillospiraceae bacterium]
MNRMKELREDRSLSMKAAALRLELPYTTYVNYEKGYREPNSETLIKIADFFHVTVDYLIGNVNDPFFVMDNERTLRDINSYGDEPFVRKATDDSIKAAFWGGDKNLSEADLDELWQDVQEYARFKAEQKKKKDR